MKMIIIGLVIGLGVGGGMFFFMKSQKPAPVAEAPRAAQGEGDERGGEGGVADASPGGDGPQDEGGIYELEPFIVNLADTSKVRYLKITIKLDLVRSKHSEDLNNHLPQIRDTLLLLLSSKEFAAIRTVEGKMELRDEILQRINAIFRSNKVKMAYFTDFVTQ